MKTLLRRHVLIFSLGIACWLLFVSTGICQTIQKLDDMYGFRDLEFGQSLASIRNLAIISTDATTKNTLGKRSSDELVFAGTSLTGITYNFFDGKLYMVILNYDLPKVGGAITGNGNIQRFLRSEYGKETTNNAAGTTIVLAWEGKRVRLNHLETTGLDNVEGFIRMESKALFEESKKFHAEVLRQQGRKMPVP